MTIIQQIEEALENTTVEGHRELEDNARDWLAHQQTIIAHQEHQLRQHQSEIILKRNLINQQSAEITELKEWIATVVNSYHHVLPFALAQEGVTMVNYHPIPKQGESP